MGVGSNWTCAQVDSEPTSMLRVRADCGGRLFPAKLTVVVHYLLHQLFDHLLADDAILLACQFCDFEALLHGTTVSPCHHGLSMRVER